MRASIIILFLILLSCDKKADDASKNYRFEIENTYQINTEENIAVKIIIDEDNIILKQVFEPYIKIVKIENKELTIEDEFGYSGKGPGELGLFVRDATLFDNSLLIINGDTYNVSLFNPDSAGKYKFYKNTGFSGASRLIPFNDNLIGLFLYHLDNDVLLRDLSNNKKIKLIDRKYKDPKLNFYAHEMRMQSDENNLYLLSVYTGETEILDADYKTVNKFNFADIAGLKRRKLKENKYGDVDGRLFTNLLKFKNLLLVYNLNTYKDVPDYSTVYVYDLNENNYKGKFTINKTINHMAVFKGKILILTGNELISCKLVTS
ncbi:MAG: hypothetical protein CSB55_07290 [Candidatus Cloacimonadota bacterium]|nr:MAG: hypothetical protein CSB55_07290 [Candidatus Cloacimonadota bacterium]